MSKRYFTIQEANALLPTVEDQLDRLQDIKTDFEFKYIELREKRQQIRQQMQSGKRDPLFELECELEFMQIEARGIIHHFYHQGIELKNIEHGLVDFPSIIGGEEVLLCWRSGEERVSFYHSRQDGFQGRRPLPED
ncbi:DUF2203 domain-containing protein [Paenibacillus sp. FJAT-26967]|uniref:DUF2203 domain-containing protein n=1 Tax=Paenibacillus sp. FJAT-26967 TaxID=1729690 RepID=UPI000838483E|nr:DUF2203 domain-containing protein [Paenibacillus sp. FJAT-26967]